MKLHSDAEETFFYEILDNYRKLVYLLTDLGITEITDALGEVIKVERGLVFSSKMTLQELEIRKNAVITAIRDAPNNSCAVSCSRDYQSQEDDIRIKHLEQLRIQKHSETKDKETKRFVMRIHNSFFHSLSLCSEEGLLSECYAPTGIHAEKPLENGLKANAKFVSVYEHTEKYSKGKNDVVVGDVVGKQLENAEIIYTDQGMYFYRIYPGGHSYNTSEIWAAFIKSLLDSDYVPAVILDPGFPNSRCFNFLAKNIEPEFYPTMLNFRDDFFSTEGINSYYDSRPEKIQIGALVITKEKVERLHLPQTSILSPNNDSMFMRNSNALLSGTAAIVPKIEEEKKKSKEREKDFCGIIIAQSISNANEHEHLKDNRSTLQAWARFLSQFISLYISKGKLELDILDNGFDLKIYNSRVRKANKRKKKKKGPITKELTENDKVNMISGLVYCLSKAITPYYHLSEQELDELYSKNKLHFFEFRLHLENLLRNIKNKELSYIEIDKTIPISLIKDKLSYMRNLLKNNCVITSIGSLTEPSQEHLIRWSFWNEDKVWRYRGGRTETTVGDFLKFVHPEKYSSYPGICITTDNNYNTDNDNDNSLEFNGLGDCEKNVSAYLVGEFVNDITFEIVTAWTDPHFGKLNLAVSMYIRTMTELYENYNTQYVVMDIKKGSYDHIVSSSAVFSWICWAGFDKYIIVKHEDSYEQKLLGGQLERFQRIELYLPLIARCIKVYNWYYGKNIIPIKQSLPFKDDKPHEIKEIPKETPMKQLQSQLFVSSFKGVVSLSCIGIPIFLTALHFFKK